MKQNFEHFESHSDLASELPELLAEKNKLELKKALTGIEEEVLGVDLEKGVLPHVDIDAEKLEQDLAMTPMEYLQKIEESGDYSPLYFGVDYTIIE